MTWIDSHCHLTFDALSHQVRDVLRRAEAAGVTDCVSIATDLSDAARVLAMSQQFDSVHAVAGIHPHEAEKVEAGWSGELLDVVSRKDVYAVGEMGLDYHYDFADRDAQKQVFETQLEIAAKVQKSIVIHSREAHDDTMSILKSAAPATPVVFHCFTGTLQEAEAIIAAGYWISLTGVVTFKKSDVLRDVARLVPADRLMIETDAPYLSPVPVRSVRPNEPSFLPHTAKCIAAARGEALETFARRVRANTIRFYGLPIHAESAL